LIFITIPFLLLSCSNDEVEGLKEEIRLLKEENNLLKAENIGLKKEIEILYKELDERALQNEKADKTAIVEDQKPKEDADGLSKNVPGNETTKAKEKEDGKSKGIR
jgi:regulator of replication initiation timing